MIIQSSGHALYPDFQFPTFDTKRRPANPTKHNQLFLEKNDKDITNSSPQNLRKHGRLPRTTLRISIDFSIEYSESAISNNDVFFNDFDVCPISPSKSQVLSHAHIEISKCTVTHIMCMGFSLYCMYRTTTAPRDMRTKAHIIDWIVAST
jgi:hypothetical protein